MPSAIARFKDVLRPLVLRMGYDTTSWNRVVANVECRRLVQELGPADLDVLEISPGEAQLWKQLEYRSYTEVNYPEFDICRDVLDRQFDVIIADNVLEHLPYPQRAVRNVYAMLRDGGYFLVMTPFLVRVHDVPIDCTRWTETGMRYLLADCGFDLERIVTNSWGNRACVFANLKRDPDRWAMRGFRSLKNQKRFPVSVWALARK